MSNTNHLSLPFIDAAQSQKHVTHNDGLNLLDVLVHLSVAARNVTAPPATPIEGMRFLLGTNTTSAFAGHAGTIAAFQDGVWRFLSPQIGWRVFCEAEDILLIYNGTIWADVGATLKSLQNMTLLGIGTAATAQNPLAAVLNAALFSALPAASGGTGDLRLSLNKTASGNTVSQLYQDNYSGRAETGLTGDDHFHVKVSPDGNLWREAINIDPTSGFVSFPSGAANGWINRVINGNFAINQRNYTTNTALAASAYGHDRWRAGAAGATYSFSQNAPDTQINITAGTLQQIVEGGWFEGGSFTLSWSGIALGSINASVPAASPIVATNLVAGANITLEFSVGTLGLVQFQAGAISSPFVRRPLTQELLLCWRYCYIPPTMSGNYMFALANSAPWRGLLIELPVLMRVPPSVQINGYSNGTAILTVETITTKHVRVRGDIAGAPANIFSAVTNLLAFAEL